MAIGVFDLKIEGDGEPVPVPEEAGTNGDPVVPYKTIAGILIADTDTPTAVFAKVESTLGDNNMDWAGVRRVTLVRREAF